MIEFWAVYGVYLFPVLIFLLFCAAAFVSARWLGPFAVKLAEKLNRPYVAEALRIFVRPPLTVFCRWAFCRPFPRCRSRCTPPRLGWP